MLGSFNVVGVGHGLQQRAPRGMGRNLQQSKFPVTIWAGLGAFARRYGNLGKPHAGAEQPGSRLW
jgi:hypothetical protein